MSSASRVCSQRSGERLRESRAPRIARAVLDAWIDGPEHALSCEQIATATGMTVSMVRRTIEAHGGAVPGTYLEGRGGPPGWRRPITYVPSDVAIREEIARLRQYVPSDVATPVRSW